MLRPVPPFDILQAYPFVVRKILRNDSTGTGSLLRDILYDADGNVKPTRMSALLNAALGYVSDRTDGFVDFDAVPDDGASVQVGAHSGRCNAARGVSGDLR